MTLLLSDVQTYNLKTHQIQRSEIISMMFVLLLFIVELKKQEHILKLSLRQKTKNKKSTEITLKN